MVGAISPLPLSAGQPGLRKPNIVFFLVDDLGWFDLGCYGNRFIETPHIDRFAAEGMRFTDAYAPASLCVPSRASMMLGQTPARLHLTNNPSANRLDARSPVHPARCPNPFVINSPTIAEMLKTVGYATAIVGKWHVDRWTLDRAKNRHGFEIAIGGPAHYSLFNPLDEPARYALVRNGIPSDEPYFVDELTDRAIAFMEKNHDRPFFLCLSHFAVHIPLVAKAAKIAKYRRKAATYRPQNGELVNVHYAAMVESVDESFGRIVKTLRRLRLEDNTIILLFSDNGGLATTYQATGHQQELEARGRGCYTEFVPATSNGPLRLGKGFLYEGGIREPCIIKWPHVTQRGSVCRVPIIGYDFFPTFCEAAGIDPQAISNRVMLDGRSLVPVLKDSAATLDREALFWHFPHFSNEGGRPSSAVRAGRWKLIEHLEYGEIELFDLQHDPGETRNLAERMPERAKGLRTMLERWRKRLNAAMPTPKPLSCKSLRGPRRAMGSIGSHYAPTRFDGRTEMLRRN
ncbi:MAG: sulfatase [Planctomycetes bacterium]|nr:sulfatase [Planctomycetota bacterium]